MSMKPLTDRQKEVLQLRAMGLSNKMVGAMLGIAEETVKNHSAGLVKAMGCHNMPHAIYKAVSNGILPLMGNFE